MAISESSHIINLSSSELFSVNLIEKISMLKGDNSFGKLIKPTLKNYNIDEKIVGKNFNVYFGLFKQQLSAIYLNK